MMRQGVKVAQGAGQSVLDEATVQEVVYGGWLDHTAFEVAGELYEESDGQSVAGIYGLAVGDASGSVPTGGSATWRGVMVAAETQRVEVHQGDATLTLDFAASNLDAAFTNVHEVETGASRASISFSDVPLTEDGFAFHADRRIEGQFFGPDHAEAGGIFESGNTVGAFGATRE